MKHLQDIVAQKALIGFVVAGDPDLETSVDYIVTLAKNGVDVIEIGLPFSDPVADGPVIMQADQRAFAAGMTTERVFELVAKVRAQTDVPLVFLTYFNPVYQYGIENFLTRMADLEVQGLIVPDLPLAEQDRLQPYLAQTGRDFIQIIAPTSSQRLAELTQNASGFLYVMSSLGITGVREEIGFERLREQIKTLRAQTNVPLAVGFGIHTPAQVRELATFVDGVIIGSGIVKIIAEHGQNAQEPLAKYVRELKTALGGA